jgi:CO/xanthine dehydrogenase Mo-binding subunit
MPVVGTNVARKDGHAKSAGLAKYIDDLSFPGMLHGRTIRSTIARGTVRDIRLDFDRAGFTIVGPDDIPGRNLIALIDDDQPCLAERHVRHVAEPLLLLAHEDRERLNAAAVGIDAVKPFPINIVDRKIQGGLGVVADDVVAGIFANIILQLVYVNTDWLGTQ